MAAALILMIDEKGYLMERVRPWGWRLSPQLPSPRAQQLREYRIVPDLEGWSCDCPDATYRHHKCKHVLALEEVGIFEQNAIAKPEAES